MRTLTRALVTVPVVVLALGAAGCGTDKGTSATGGASRTVDITMTDNAYQPANVTVAKGETVTFKFKNNGTVKHEAILGDNAAQMNHHQQMTAATGNMDHAHMGQASQPDSDAITVMPGMTGEITHTFTEAGPMMIGCHEPGHWEAGMKAMVNIS